MTTLVYESIFTVHQTQTALVVRPGEPVQTVTQPGLHFKVPLIANATSEAEQVRGGGDGKRNRISPENLAEIQSSSCTIERFRHEGRHYSQMTLACRQAHISAYSVISSIRPVRIQLREKAAVAGRRAIMTILNVRHTTSYRYRRPVHFGDHRLMLRPRDSHDLRLIQTSLTCSPPAKLTWQHDVFGNSIAIASFADPAAELRIGSALRLETYVTNQTAFQIAPEAASYPFIYSTDDRIDLGGMLELQHPDPDDRLGSWARGFVRSNPTDTSALLADLNSGISGWISYQSRETEGTQTPIETLNRGWGSCRDLAVLLIEAARTLGFGARVVTGYLYNPDADGRANASVAAGTTHAWAEIYVKGSGWIAYDPTNRTIGGADLIRVAVTRNINQAVPISGSFVGARGDYCGMTVNVSIRRE